MKCTYNFRENSNVIGAFFRNKPASEKTYKTSNYFNRTIDL